MGKLARTLLSSLSKVELLIETARLLPSTSIITAIYCFLLAAFPTAVAFGSDANLLSLARKGPNRTED